LLGQSHGLGYLGAGAEGAAGAIGGDMMAGPPDATFLSGGLALDGGLRGEKGGGYVEGWYMSAKHQISIDYQGLKAEIGMAIDSQKRILD
jgi:hypothetical protein